jgi:chemotaxis protein methyltransferase CheR
MSAAAADFGFKNVQTFVQWLLTSPLTKNHLGILANHFTIGETYFFREKRSFEILQEHIFPALLHSRRGTAPCLRIWSAGCSTGEEPYSVAILLNTMLHYFKDWHITILATDITRVICRRL